MPVFTWIHYRLDEVEHLLPISRVALEKYQTFENAWNAEGVFQVLEQKYVFVSLLLNALQALEKVHFVVNGNVFVQ